MVTERERVPRVRDPETISRMMDPSTSRLASLEDRWHVFCLHGSCVSWGGRKIVKNQFDLARYFYLLHQHRPEVVVETGLQGGGSALFFLDALAALGMYDVPYVGVDLDAQATLEAVRAHCPGRPALLVSADCLADATIREIAPLMHRRRALVILDSVHTEEHVTEELRLYAPLVEPGGRLVVEDTDHNGQPMFGSYGPSAFEAVSAFMREEGLGRQLGYEHDLETERLFSAHPGAQPFTNSPRGWLVRHG